MYMYGGPLAYILYFYGRVTYWGSLVWKYGGGWGRWQMDEKLGHEGFQWEIMDKCGWMGKYTKYHEGIEIHPDFPMVSKGCWQQMHL